jgi:aspartyl-tRNA(Asn)/glutamyl-tRNA(Gln) amidotransferase subunit B
LRYSLFSTLSARIPSSLITIHFSPLSTLSSPLCYNNAMKFIPVIGLEVHAELQTRTKMFCSCPVVDSTQALPNTTVCPVCAGMPGVLPVVNRAAVEYALRVALALECRVNSTSLFARKNYFYPDLPKGYQISQYEYPLAEYGVLRVPVGAGEKCVHIRRVHLEEDTGKLTHVHNDEEQYSLVDLNRAGVPLLEIVTEPDMGSLEEVRAYATGLRAVLVALGVNSGDMSKGVMRFEANVSLRRESQRELGTRVEIKNLNSFRAMERAIAYEIERQSALLEAGQVVQQQTLGWDETTGETFAQRGKEEAHDYRYFPEPDLPPLVVDEGWIERVRAGLPELPEAKRKRLQRTYDLTGQAAALLAQETAVAAYFEAAMSAAAAVEASAAVFTAEQASISPMDVANWISGPLFSWMNQSKQTIDRLRVGPQALVELLAAVGRKRINQTTARGVLTDMLESGRSAGEIIAEHGLEQISDADALAGLVREVLREHPAELESYLAGKQTLSNWFFGQVMRKAGGKADPGVLRAELEKQLESAAAGLQS